MTQPDAIGSVLLRAAEIQLDRGHTKGRYKYDGRVCASQAITEALCELPHWEGRFELAIRVRNHVGRYLADVRGEPIGLTVWNDTACRSAKMAAALLRGAAEQPEVSGGS